MNLVLGVNALTPRQEEAYAVWARSGEAAGRSLSRGTFRIRSAFSGYRLYSLLDPCLRLTLFRRLPAGARPSVVGPRPTPTMSRIRTH